MRVSPHAHDHVHCSVLSVVAQLLPELADVLAHLAGRRSRFVAMVVLAHTRSCSVFTLVAAVQSIVARLQPVVAGLQSEFAGVQSVESAGACPTHL